MAWQYWNSASGTSTNYTTYTNDTITGAVWSHWNNPSTTCTASSTSYDDNQTGTWYYWMNGTPNSNGSAGEEAWIRWTTTKVEVAIEPRQIVPKLSKQERRRIKAKNARDRAVLQKAKKRALRRKGREAMAEVTAQELLGELIGDEQLKVYRETGRLLVKGRNFDYLIQKGGKTKRLKKNKVIDLCVHINNPYDDNNRVQMLPQTDRVIGLALAAKLDESKFNETANIVQTVKRNDPLPKAAVY